MRTRQAGRWFFSRLFLIGLVLPGLALGGILVTDNVDDQGQKCFKIETASATYFFQKEAAGFSSILDKEGNDWVSYKPGGGSSGEYRGVPNLGPCFHPGNTGSSGSTSTISNQTADKVSITSTSQNGFVGTWEFSDTQARLTITKANGDYWFLYEGTPGGATGSEDYYYFADGKKNDIGKCYEGELSPEWAVFFDGNKKRGLLLVHHKDDNLSDSYWYMQNAMTVFGFGRKSDCGSTCCPKYFKQAGEVFTIAFIESDAFADAKAAADKILAGETRIVARQRDAFFSAQVNARVLSAAQTYDIRGRKCTYRAPGSRVVLIGTTAPGAMTVRFYSH